MEATKIMENGAALPDAPLVSEADTQERVLKFSSNFRGDRPNGQGGERGDGLKRDWSSAIDLVNEAFEAIRLADERAVAAENYHAQLVQHHKEQVKNLEARIAAAEKRADAAESRLKDAESWLARFHDTIVDGFQRTFTAK